MDALVASHAGAARRSGPQRSWFLHDRPALPRGVLHARARRTWWHPDQPRRRQHPTLHGHRCGGPQGVLRIRRPAGLLHRRRPRRRDSPLRTQRRRDPDSAVDAHSRSPRGRRPAGDPLHRPPADASGPGSHRPPGAAAGHERRTHERAVARGDLEWSRRPGVGAGATRSATTTSRSWSAATRQTSSARSATSRRTTSGPPHAWWARRMRCSRPCSRASTSPIRPRPRPSRSTTCTCSEA